MIIGWDSIVDGKLNRLISSMHDSLAFKFL